MNSVESNSSKIIKAALLNLKLGLNTSAPGYVVNFYPDDKPPTADIQISTSQRLADGAAFDYEVIPKVPVQFPGSKGFYVETEVKPGDEGIVHFCMRSIEQWKEHGGKQVPERLRFHDINDAVFTLGYRSSANSIQDYQNNGIRLRNLEGTEHIWLKNDGTAEIKITSLKVIGDIDHEGDQTSTGTITAKTDVIAAGISSKDHEHLPGDYNVNGTPVAGSSGKPK